MLEAGLVYRKESSVNWDPVDMTVLANEQVIDGKGWRSGAPVEKRKLNQWFLKITQFADDLLEGLKTLYQWPDKVRTMQENWIGRSQGLQFTFAPGEAGGAPIAVYSTRPDTIFGASFVAISGGAGGGGQQSGRAGLHRPVQGGRHHGGGAGDRGEAGLRHRPVNAASVRCRLEAARLHREFRADGLWHRRGHGRSRA
jgi:hypothetical protein